MRSLWAHSREGRHLAPTSVSLVLRVSALARRMLPGPFDMPLFVRACSEWQAWIQREQAGW